MARPPQVTIADTTAEEASSDVLLVGAFAGSTGFELQGGARAVDDALDGHVSELGSMGFKGNVGETAVVPTLGKIPAARVAVVGLGPKEAAGPKELRRSAAMATRQLAQHREVASLLQSSISDEGLATRATVEGLVLGTYRYTDMKSDPAPSKIERLVLLGGDEKAVDTGIAIAEATFLARDLINEPASSLTPDALARKASEVADVAGLGCEILDEEALEERGLGGLLGVGQGSDEPPRLIKLTYTPSDPTGKVALVGKGITYDSGGYSLKPSASMELMKTDMAGGAAVIATMSTLKRLGVSLEVVAFVPASENLVSGGAIKPGDVLRQYGGRTVEVNNTDAEGRLVLADALGLASEEAPDAIVDVATLTATIHLALGPRVTGVFSNDDALAKEILDASEVAGEDMWRMPIVDAYRKELDSSTADMRNSGSRYGGAIIASLFLREFVRDGVPWAHLDIAGTGRADSDYDEKTKGGTAVGVRTLVSWLLGRSR